MSWWYWALIDFALIYAIGFMVILIFHLALLHMVSVNLAFARAAVWPIFWATGWPHGTPMPMD